MLLDALQGTGQPPQPRTDSPPKWQQCKVEKLWDSHCGEVVPDRLQCDLGLGKHHVSGSPANALEATLSSWL